MTLTLKTPTPPTFIIENDKVWHVCLIPIQGETGRFHAFSETRFRCKTCFKLFNAKEPKPCPKCGCDAGRLVYILDVTENKWRGRCSCEGYTTSKAMPKRCKHTDAAFYLFGILTAKQLAGKEDE